MEMIIKRDEALKELIQLKGNRMVKVVTGVRRCGKSFLLGTLFRGHLIAEGVPRDHIIEMSFDLFRNRPFRDPEVFFPWVTEQLVDDNPYYILLDEVQLLGEFVDVLNDLAARPNCDVYVTGSNAKFLSKDIATEFGGRSTGIHLQPLSFAEFMTVFDGNEHDGMDAFLRYGSLPLVVLQKTEAAKRKILKELLQETYLRDVVARNRVRNPTELSTLLSVLASTIGGLTNPAKLARTFRSVSQSGITATTLGRYLTYLEDAFLVETARRYDIAGRSYIGTPQKYYFTDMGLANAQLDFRQEEVAHAMENAVFMELRRRGYVVDVGNLAVVEPNASGSFTRKFTEIDFVCNKDSRRVYVQVAYSLDTKEKRAQEMRPFLRLKEFHRRVLITYTALQPHYSEEGVLMMSLFDFLRASDSLELNP